MKQTRLDNSNKNIRVFAQDESRLGLQQIIRKVWTPTGERPSMEIDPRYEWFYVCSSIEPITGDHFSQIWSTMNLTVMQYYLESFSEYLEENIAIMVCDRAYLA